MFKPAVKEKLKLRLAIEGPSGSGKTYSSLLIARGLVGPSGKIAMIDTEKRSGLLYSDLSQFDHATLDEPYTPERYIALLSAAEKAGYDCVIIDSMSHEWVGAGGILEIHDKMPGNSWTNWSKVNPRHEAFINTILKSPCHIISTMRSKQSYTQEADGQGKQQVKKLGMAPQQRDGMEYEFTAVIKMDISHQAQGDKDRTGLFPVDVWFLPSEQTGADLARWLNAGVEGEKQPPPQPEQRQQPSRDLEWYKTSSRNECANHAELTAWWNDHAADISKLSQADQKTLIAHCAALKKSMSEKQSSAPKTVDCPHGGKVVPDLECKECPDADKCEHGKK